MTQSIPEKASMNQIAALLGKTRKQLERLISLGMPVDVRPEHKGQQWRFNVSDVVQWLAKRNDKPIGELMSYEEGRQREQAARARMAEYDLAERSGTMVNVETFDKVLASHIVPAKARILELGEELKKVSTEDVANLIDDRIEDALIALQGLSNPVPEPEESDHG